MFRVSLCLLFIAIIYPSYAQKSVETAEVSVGAALEVRCRLAEAGGAEWRRDGAEVRGDRAEEVSGGELWAVLRVPHAAPEHAGLYTCARPPTHAVRVRVTGIGDKANIQYYDVHRPITINCSLPNIAGLPAQWFKNGTEVSAVRELKDRYELRGDSLYIGGKSTDDDHGPYKCQIGNETHEVDLHGRPVAKLSPDTAAVEGQALRIKCRVLGRPAVAASWTFSNDTINGTDVVTALGADRVELRVGDGGAENAELVVKEARLEDAGIYNCTAGLSEATTTVRVKDKYAALWPFLGICAEVLLLCAVILIYERRRSKPEPEDEDDHKKS